MDVGVVLGVDAIELGMQSRVAGAGQPGKALVDLDEGIALFEVDVVVLAGHPGRHGVGDLVGLGLESFALDEATQGLGVAEHLVEARRRAHAGAKFLFVVAPGGRGHLPGALVVDILTLVVIGEDAFGSILL